MDALIETSDQLSMVFNWLCGSNIVIQSFFILIVMTKTPREMTTLRYTLMNTVSWSLLIVIQFGVVVRPVAFLPLPVCLITGPAKWLGTFWGGHFQVLIGLILLINKSTAYLLCLSSHFFAVRFPVFFRRLSLKDGVFIFIGVHLGISVFLIVCAYASGLFAPTLVVTTEVLKQSIAIYTPAKYKSLNTVINESLIIGVPKKSLHCFYTLVYLILSLSEIIISVSLMIYAISFLTRSIHTDKSSNSRNFKKRLIALVSIRTIIPMLTFHLPAFFVVYIVQFDRDDTSAFAVQWCIWLILFSPAACGFMTILGLKPYRKALFRLIRLKMNRFMERESETEQLSENTGKRSILTIRSSTVYTTRSSLTNTNTCDDDTHANRL